MVLVIAGLGNPGKEYEKTRHNAGRMVAQAIATGGDFDDFAFNKTANAHIAKGTLARAKATIVLPDTMMNGSGKAIAAFVKTPRSANNLLVIHDDLDLPLGTIKMVSGRGSGGHKGVESIMRAIKSREFARIRIGISSAGKKNQARKPTTEEKVIKHVLGAFTSAETSSFRKSLKKAVETAELFSDRGLAAAMQFANTH